jgi:hypothetical protein
MKNLIERARAIAPRRVEGRHNDFALFNMAGLCLQELNLLINDLADALEQAMGEARE